MVGCGWMAISWLRFVEEIEIDRGLVRSPGCRIDYTIVTDMI